jgi:hypothetical protein
LFYKEEKQSRKGEKSARGKGKRREEEKKRKINLISFNVKPHKHRTQVISPPFPVSFRSKSPSPHFLFSPLPCFN